jgi:pimeloyl-ACP methyl ester carboxylesterase
VRQAIRHLYVVAAMGLALVLAGCSDDSDRQAPVEPQPMQLPIVFVHGQLGSAQQFETQAMRFTSNGYPRELLFAFEYDTGQDVNPLGDLDDFLNDVLAATGASQVYAIGHSRGTSVWTAYLEDAAFDGPGKVAKYVNIDGRSPEALPGGVPTIGIWGEWNSAGSGFNRREDGGDAQIGPDPEANYHFPEKSHTETATSAEAFALMYRFLTGVEPATTEVNAETSGTVEVAGRVLLFPDNIGYGAATLQLWEIDADTGQRTAASPAATFELGDSGDFGPVAVSVDKDYEFALLRAATEALPVPTVHHFYGERFYHDNYFVRLLTSIPGESIEAAIPLYEDSASLVMSRQKEFWGDQGATSDELFIDGLNVLTADISPRAVGEGSGVNLAVFAFDAEGDNITDLERGELFPFSVLTFLTGVDVFIPAASGGTGTTEIVLVHRGGEETRLNVPNWPSADNRVSVMFRDDR